MAIQYQPANEANLVDAPSEGGAFSSGVSSGQIVDSKNKAAEAASSAIEAAASATTAAASATTASTKADEANASAVAAAINASTLTQDLDTNGNDITLGDNDEAIFGAGNDLQIYHDAGGDSYIKESGSGQLYIEATNLRLKSAGDETYLTANADGAVSLYHDNSIKLATTATGVDVTGDVSLPDDGKVTFGAGDDLQIYHNGIATFIDEVGTGSLNIRATDHLFTDPVGNNKIIATTGGSVDLFHNASKKLATTATGIDVTGNITFGDSDKAIFGAGNDLKIYHDGANSWVDESGTGNLNLTTNGGAINFTSNGENLASFNTNGAVTLYHDNSIKLATTSTGIDVTGDINVNSSYPRINLTDEGDNPDYSIINSDGIFTIYDVTNASNRLALSTAGLGIGMSPAEVLDLKASSGDTRIRLDAASGADTEIKFWNDGVAQYTIGHDDSSDNFVIGGANVDAPMVSVDKSGKLLVGKTTSSPTTAGVELQTGTGAYGALVATASVQPLLLNRLSTDGGIAVFRKDNTNVGSIGSRAGVQLYIGDGNSALLFVDSTNQILPHDIATNAPTDNILDLGGSSSRFKDLYLSGTVTANKLKLVNDATDGIKISRTSGASENLYLGTKASAGISGTDFPAQIEANGCNLLEVYTQGSQPVVFGTDSTERMRIDSSGRALVGITGASGFGQLETTTFATEGQCILARTGGSVLVGATSIIGAEKTHISFDRTGEWGLCIANTSSTAPNNATMIDFRYAGSQTGYIGSNGTTTSYNTSSDQRLKENIADADDAGSKIDAIQVRQFDWKIDGEHQNYGMIAQELIEVAPEAVTEGETEDDMMAVDYSKLVPTLIKEIQTLRNRVAQLENNE
jgi:hypothetical protein